jgi:quinol monooxygenase YgiN
MPKIIFEINYNIIPEKRDSYLEMMKDLRARIRETGVEYSVYESKKDPDNFTEVFICKDEDEFESLEDNQSEETFQLTQKLFDEYIVNKKAIYTTKFEI